MVRDYWVYQKRQSATNQWALYIVKEFQRGKPSTTTLDFTVYCEDIGSPTHSLALYGLHYPSVNGYVDSLICEMLPYMEITAEDKRQLEESITWVLQD